MAYHFSAHFSAETGVIGSNPKAAHSQQNVRSFHRWPSGYAVDCKSNETLLGGGSHQEMAEW
tara:strand:- start:282 stop:467 length:186 start_codon:yes stop_codon:yes gene_type:complete